MANIEKRSNGVWRARYCDDAGKLHTRHLPPQGRRQGVDRHGHGLSRARRYGSEDARTTVEQWCATWLKGYATRRASTVREARVQSAQIKQGVWVDAAR